jgi:hypothetical protein
MDIQDAGLEAAKVLLHHTTHAGWPFIRPCCVRKGCLGVKDELVQVGAVFLLG